MFLEAPNTPLKTASTEVFSEARFTVMQKFHKTTANELVFSNNCLLNKPLRHKRPDWIDLVLAYSQAHASFCANVERSIRR
jgi:hypothetical protein